MAKSFRIFALFKRVEFMKIKHTGLNIRFREDVEKFYHGLLGFRTTSKFKLNKALSEALFGIDSETEVFYLVNDEVELELFFNLEPISTGYNHICLEVNKLDDFVTKARQAGFLHYYRERSNKQPLVFIKDTSGNIFEIKERL